ncbi:solute carrier family 41 member 2-like [Pollicipes pollicipes]|uniref:solute carrier family 41 member 2-like n=1 Tax=Pollicipes pollicipes TaxID=41117 RepID=UPI001885093E|nr:solute carrier family 41 member 2-like [Pollicipes pollicipes]
MTYRAEGGANIVISLPRQGRVLRFPKTAHADPVARLRRLADYRNHVIAPLLGEADGTPWQVVRLAADERRRLAADIEERHGRLRRVSRRRHRCPSPPPHVFSVEIKAKQGFLAADDDLGVCSFCMKQYLKLKRGTVQHVSGYCPLDLFSGQFGRVDRALRALLDSPQNNLRVFMNGPLPADEESTDPVVAMQRYSIGATMRDASLMITLRRAAPGEDGTGFRAVTDLAGNRWLCLCRLMDLDPKHINRVSRQRLKKEKSRELYLRAQLPREPSHGVPIPCSVSDEGIDHLLAVSGSPVAADAAGSVMIAVIVLSQRFSINPDNVATPIAASMGDLVTLALLSWIASLLHRAIEPDPWLAPTIIAVYLLLIPLFAWVSHRNQYTRVVLLEGWTPVIAAMLISSAGGLILDFAVSAYEGVAVFQPVINGVGGNLVAVQASRISTELHRAGRPGQRPRAEHAPLHVCLTPWAAFCQTGGHSRTARVLLSMVVPGHLVFTYSISYFRAGHTSLTPLFLVVYNCAAVLQVVVLLYVAHCMIHWMWKNGVDPDNSAIPYLTALGDLIGTGLLALAFQFLFIIGDRDSDLGD